MNLTDQGQAVRVAAFEPRSLVNGPGARAVLWVQGCGRRCPGCFNPDFLPRIGGRDVPVGEVVGWIALATESVDGRLEGVTFSGGEPFDQASALAAVARAVRGLGLGVMIFSGNPQAALLSKGEAGWKELIEASDLIVAGPYERGSPGDHPLLSSGNQELMHVTERYRSWAETARQRARKVEIKIGTDGVVRMTGFPGEKMRAGVHRDSHFGLQSGADLQACQLPGPPALLGVGHSANPEP